WRPPAATPSPSTGACRSTRRGGASGPGSASGATSTPRWRSHPGRWSSARPGGCSLRRAAATVTSSTSATGCFPTLTPPRSSGSSSLSTGRPPADGPPPRDPPAHLRLGGDRRPGAGISAQRPWWKRCRPGADRRVRPPFPPDRALTATGDHRPAGRCPGRLLAERHGPGAFSVSVGMQHSEPWIADAVDAMVAAGITTILGTVLAPQYSRLILSGYEREVDRARSRHPGLEIAVAGAWHTMPGWIEGGRGRITEALAEAPAGPPGAATLIFTAHSLPRSVVDRDPGYLLQLHQTVDAVVDRLRLAEGSWRFGWQSAGHSPAEWPDPALPAI